MHRTAVLDQRATESGFDRRVLDLLPDPVIVYDHAFAVVAANRRAEEHFAARVEDWLGRTPIELVHPDDRAIVLACLDTVWHKRVGRPVEVRLRDATGGWRLMEVVGSAGVLDGVPVLATAMRDLTERRRYELAGNQPEQFRSIVEHASIVLALVDRDGRVRSTSGAFVRQLGHDVDHVVGRELADFIVAAERDAFVCALRAAAHRSTTTVFETTMRHRDGTPVPYSFSVANLVDDPVVGGLIVSASDISARRQLEQKLTELASSDALTGLENRRAIVARIEAWRRDTGGAAVRVFFADLDRFTAVNDFYGHQNGDVVLVETARRLATLTRAERAVGRVGSDEFVIVTRDVDEAAAPAFAAEVEQLVQHPIALPTGATVRVGVSIGSVDATAATTGDALVAEADAAMHRVKTRRRGLPMHRVTTIARGRALAEHLDAALAGDASTAGLQLHYQPVVRLDTTEVVSAEALIRWEHADLGMLAPAEFLPVAEDAGLGSRLDTWVLETAARQVARWGEHAPGVVAVNVSASPLAATSFAPPAKRVLARHGVDPRRIGIEITETSMVQRGEHGVAFAVTRSLAALKALGVRIAIDDFGTGFSSLVHVREMPADVLKIDRSFVASVTTDQASRGVVAAVVTMAHAIGMTVVAEGVEDDEQLAAVSALGADLGQGYHFGRPLPPHELERLLVRAGARTLSGRTPAVP